MYINSLKNKQDYNSFDKTIVQVVIIFFKTDQVLTK